MRNLNYFRFVLPTLLFLLISLLILLNTLPYLSTLHFFRVKFKLNVKIERNFSSFAIE